MCKVLKCCIWIGKACVVALKLRIEGGMELFKRFTKEFTIQVGVNLSCGNAFVAQHFLHGAQVCTAFYQVGRKGMAESVG